MRRPVVATVAPSLRSYDRVLRRLRQSAAALPACRVEQIGTATYGRRRYPLLMLRIAVGPATPHRRPLRVCLGAGIHGNESAGVEAVLHWLGALPSIRRRLPRADLTIFPCMNPSGYARDRRTSDRGIDLNRQYKNARAPVEIRAVRRALTGRRFDLSIEFHEDVDSPGFYLYELTDERRTIGEQLIAAASRTLPINHADEIEGMAARTGMIQRNRRTIRRRRRSWPHAIYLFHLGTPRCLTLETPVSAPLRRRSLVHAQLLTLALRLCARRY